MFSVSVVVMFVNSLHTAQDRAAIVFLILTRILQLVTVHHTHYTLNIYVYYKVKARILVTFRSNKVVVRFDKV